MLKFKEIFKFDGRMKIAGLIALLNVFLAISAFVKDLFLASYLGTTVHADVFLLAFFICDTIGNNIMGFSLGISSIPVFTSARINKGKSFLAALLLLTALSFILIMICIAALLVFNKGSLISIFSGGLSRKTPLFFSAVFNLLLPVLIFYPLYHAGNAVLQSSDKLTIGIFSSIIFNLIFLFSILCVSSKQIPAETGMLYISSAVLTAVFIQFAVVWLALFRCKVIDISGLISQISSNLKDSLEYLKLAFKMFIPYLLMVFFSQAMLFIERFFASSLTQGALAALNYAYRLSQMPVWIFVSAIGVAVFPVMARLSEGKSGKGEVAKILAKSLKYMAFTVIPMMFVLYAMRYPIVTILFKRGAFDDTSVRFTCDILAGYSLGILGQGITVLSLRYYLAIKRIIKPLIILTLTFALNIVLDLYLIKSIGLAGIGFGSAISNTVCGGFFIWDIISRTAQSGIKGS